MLGFVATLWGGKFNLYCKLSLLYPGKGISARLPLPGCKHYPQLETVWINPAKSWIFPLSVVPSGEGKTTQSMDIQNVRSLEAIVWDWEKVISPVLQAGLVSSLT